MRVEVEADLGIIDIGIQTDCLQLEHIWVNGEDFWGRSAEDLVIACIGWDKLNEMALIEETRRESTNYWKKDRLDEE